MIGPRDRDITASGPGGVESCHHKGLGQKVEACVAVAGGILVQEAMRQELALCLISTFESLAGVKERTHPLPVEKIWCYNGRRSGRPS